MDNSQIKITSQNQRLTAQIDWILVYDSFVKSNCSLVDDLVILHH